MWMGPEPRDGLAWWQSQEDIGFPIHSDNRHRFNTQEGQAGDRYGP